MAKILQKRIPKKTDKSNQQKTMRVWSIAIVEKYSSGQAIPIVDAKQYRSKTESYITNSVINKE